MAMFSPDGRRNLHFIISFIKMTLMGPLCDISVNRERRNLKIPRWLNYKCLWMHTVLLEVGKRCSGMGMEQWGKALCPFSRPTWLQSGEGTESLPCCSTCIQEQTEKTGRSRVATDSYGSPEPGSLWFGEGTESGVMGVATDWKPIYAPSPRRFLWVEMNKTL